jgi:glycosyltransferase involved in cell wall biosynthesis
VRIALDATYSLGEHLSGVGVYSQELLRGLARIHPEQRFQWCYRAHRYLRSFAGRLPSNCQRTLLQEPWLPLQRALFHGLNQRLPALRFRKTVTTFHDLFVLTGDYSTPEFRRRFAEQARHAAAASDLIIAISQFTAGQVVQHLGVEPERIHVIHHGVRAPAGSAAVAHENVILNVGAIQRRKNIGRLVTAFEGIAPGWQLVLAGSAGFGAEEILRQIELSPRRDSICVLGYVTAQELTSWYARARVFAFPSLDEGFGMPVLEAMAAGVPVVASNRSALPEVCGTAALLVDPEETEALAHALDQVIQNKELADDLTRRGKLRAAEFTWDQAAEKTWNVYEKLVEKT